MSQTIPTPSPSISPQGAEILAGLAADAGVAGGQPQGSTPVVASDATPQEFEVDDGGAKRRVSRKDLEDAYRERNKLAQQQQAINDRLAELGQMKAVKELGDVIANLPPDRRAMVADIIAGRTPQRTQADMIREEAFGDEGQSGPAASGDQQLRAHIEQLSNVVKHLAASEHRRLQESQQRTMSEQADELMGKFPVFQRDPGAKMFAKDFILKSVGPDADLETVVREAASRLQRHFDPKPDPAPSAGGQRDAAIALPRGAAPTATTLKSGDIRRAAMQLLQGQ